MPGHVPRRDGKSPQDLRSALTRQRILDAARQVFLLNGLAGTTSEQIADLAGVSSGTLQRHFGGKETLFTTLVLLEAERIARVLPSIDLDESEPVARLRQIGSVVLETLDSPATAAAVRLIIGALGRLPRLGEEFLRKSLGPTTAQIAACLDACADSVDLRGGNSRAAAEDFARRCFGHVAERVFVPGQPLPREADYAAAAERILQQCGVGWRRSAPGGRAALMVPEGKQA
ncbi:MAG: TetR/AcrR family transcriptional regulator [Hyphomicrobiales bacterium]|uniref:TetR/AcrR family transcriptional regulator n=1 Tax=Rhabdaerophilum calidifontis TaxID=2604328 RepID=UPI00123BA96D|nr:TetR/AcrR family transcriptional regulator [Rhabdaerophilum calidifontis]MCA1952050.1 TetR/AcrR family transcriptional regulator [Hyphomicrobiales bacterium]MCA1999132.1 TetR/AcrR family transcriptional regulator [Hyphomicrobiales bacterium]